MKHTLQLLGLGLLLASLSSCDTYIEGHGHARRPGYWNGHTHTHTHTDHYYSRRPSYRPAGPSLNTNIGAGLRL